MDAFLAVASRREVREYSDRPVPDAAVRRILEAGRIAGSSRTRQPWRFLLVADSDVRERVARTVYAAGNVRGALVVAVAVRGGGPTAFDARRAAQNVMLAPGTRGSTRARMACPIRMASRGCLGSGRTSAP